MTALCMLRWGFEVENDRSWSKKVFSGDKTVRIHIMKVVPGLQHLPQGLMSWATGSSNFLGFLNSQTLRCLRFSIFSRLLKIPTFVLEITSSSSFPHLAIRIATISAFSSSGDFFFRAFAFFRPFFAIVLLLLSPKIDSFSAPKNRQNHNLYWQRNWT